MEIRAEIEGKDLVVRVPFDEPMQRSQKGKGKTFLLASSHGNQKVEIEGCTFWVSLNCYTYPNLVETFRKPKPKQKKLSAAQKAKVDKQNAEVTERMKKKNGKV